MIDQDSLQKLKNILTTKDNFLVIGHEKPDGDCIGSVLAFSVLLENLDKKSTLVIKDEVPAVFRFLDGSDKIQNDFETGGFEAVILLDNGDARRTGFYDRVLEFKKKKITLVNIDHHSRNDLWKIADLNISIEEASSTCEILYQIALDLEFPFNSKLSTALLTGLHNDTGGFRHSNTSEEVLKITSELLKKGARLKKISDNIIGSHSISMLKLWGIALNRLSFNSSMKLSFSVLTYDDIKAVNATEDEVSGLVNLLNSAPESEIALLLYGMENGKLRGSLRTENDKIDLSVLANLLGGGGHKKASGFMVNGKIERGDNGWKIT